MEKIYKINVNGSSYEIQDKPLSEQVATLKGDLANYYTKTEIDNMVGNINNALNQI